MLIELLYFDGCPFWQEGIKNLETALKLEGLKAEISLVKIEDNSHAQQQKFLGSPSFRINGKDLWAEERTHYSLNCRVYQTPQGMRGAPSVEMLQEKLRALPKQNP
jgi:hypothetical protein